MLSRYLVFGIIEVIILPVYEIFCFYLFQQYSQPQQTLYSVQQQVCLILTVYITINLKIMLVVCLVGFVFEIILVWEVVKEMK